MNIKRTLDSYPGVSIHASGIVTRDSDGKALGSLNNSGYITLTLTRADGHRCAIGRNRLVAMAFIDCPGDFEDYVVNHKDFDRTNDAVDNLEWLTIRDNLAYSGKNNPSFTKFKAIQVKDFDTGVVTDFDCMIEAARTLGLTKDTVQWRSKSNGKILYEDRKQFRLSSEEPWPHPWGTFLLVKDVIEGEVQRFLTAKEASEATGISQASISICLSRKTQPLLKSRYLLKSEHDLTEWRQIGDIFREIAKQRKSTPVQVFNPKTGQRRVFVSAIDCAREMGIKPTTLNMRLKSGDGSKIYSDGFQYQMSGYAAMHN